MVYPIMTPSHLFKDKYNNTNVYVDMNTSMFISQETVTILVRKVNYSKFSNKDYVCYDTPTSIYCKIECSLKNDHLDLDNATYKELTYTYNIPTYSSYWTGLEDIRFVNEDKLLVIIPECNPNGNPSIFIANAAMNQFVACEPSTNEKNWMPFTDNGVEKVIYSVYPFTLKSLQTSYFETIPVTFELPGYHGSTNGIPFQDAFLFLIHINRERTYHRWLMYNPTTHHAQVSNEFIFFATSYIEFPCSLCSYKDTLFVSLGVNDNKSFILEIKQDVMLQMFT